MDISEFRRNYVSKVKINLYTPEELEKVVNGQEVETNEDTPYIILKELSSVEMKELNEENINNINVLQKYLPKAIIEHSFPDAKNEQVSAAIIESASLFSYVIEKWMGAMHLKKTKEEN